MDPTIAIGAIFAEHLRVAAQLDALAPEVARAAALIVGELRKGARLLLCGNGGSAADAQHIAAELTGRFLRDRRPIPALALHTNTSSLTAIGNDFGYDEVFAREVLAHGRAGDVLLALSTSGNSANVVRAIAAAREQGMKVVSMTGKSGGKLKELSDVCLCMPSSETPRIQEVHIVVGHALCELIEDALSA